ncbi:SphA family protein [Flexithrix dorotheae]|uniref:SphA family protein n=1 Tax=Flexithrix dorotheae TaxID=70993 RepID=UPI00036FEFC2|nr:transporter [Flexithrix dorotheae]
MKLKITFTKRALKLSAIMVGLWTISFVQDAKSQQVSPFQTGHYLPAFSNIRDMAKPTSGFFVLWYNYYQTSNSYYNRDGNKVDKVSLSEINPNLPDIPFDVGLNAFATAPAFFWAAKKPVLGGARYMAGIVPVYFSVKSSFNSEVSGSISDKLSGFSDLYLTPLTLSWGFEKLDFTFAYGLYTPVGRYETGADDNLGLGFWTNQFQGFGYFYPVADKSTALMLGLTYEVNSKIKDEDFKPGNRFSLEYGISQYLSEKLEVGVQGGNNWQVSDDKGDDVFWDPSIHDKKGSLAFNAGYWVWKDRLQLNAKYGFDYGAVQRFKNDILMFNLVFVTNALTGE